MAFDKSHRRCRGCVTLQLCHPRIVSAGRETNKGKADVRLDLLAEEQPTRPKAENRVAKINPHLCKPFFEQLCSSATLCINLSISIVMG